MDKNKIIEAAAKYVAKGAYDKAIKEYQKVLEVDPHDVRILQKLGELYQKRNEPALAAECLVKVAENYASDGFFQKAVSLYKQVLKLSQNPVQVNLRLAELHQQLLLLGEAMAYYQLVVSQHEKSGDLKACMQVLRKMLELDPENVGSRVRLAELYATDNLRSEAIAEFTRAASSFRANHRTDDYLRVLERLSALEPENVTRVRELAEAYLARGEHKRALAKLQTVFKANPKEPEILRLLANSYLGLGQIAKSVAAFKELAMVYAAAGQREDADRIWQQVAQLDPKDPDLPMPVGAVKSASYSQSVPTVGQTPMEASQSGQHVALGREHLRKLLGETDVYVKYGLFDKALEHLKKIFAVEPENLGAHEKAYQIYVASQHADQAQEQLLNVLRLCARQGEVERAQPYLQVLLDAWPTHPELPAFLAVLKPSSLEDASSESADVAVSLEAPSSEHELSSEMVLLGDDFPILDAPLDAPLEAPVEPMSFEKTQVDLPHPFEEGNALASWPEEVVRVDYPPPHAAPMEDSAASDTAVMAQEEVEPHQEECEEANFFLEQGLTDEAQEILETILLAYPGHIRAQRLLHRITNEAEPTPVSQETALSGLESVEDEHEFLSQPSLDSEPSDFSRALRPDDVTTHYDLALAYKEMGLWEDAMMELEVALTGGRGQLLEGEVYSVMGAMHMERQQYESAVACYRKGLAAGQLSEAAACGLRFDLALALEEAGERGKALFHYAKVKAVAPDFRDVKERVTKLSALVSPTPDVEELETPSTVEKSGDRSLKSHRVGYV